MVGNDLPSQATFLLTRNAALDLRRIPDRKSDPGLSRRSRTAETKRLMACAHPSIGLERLQNFLSQLTMEYVLIDQHK